MWPHSHSRHTQRGVRRRNHLGVLACLLAVLFTGILIGRLTGDEEQEGHIVLSETAPPAAAAGVSPTPSAKLAQPRAGRIARHTTSTATPRATRSTPRPSRPAHDQIPGQDAIGDPTQVLGGDGGAAEPVRLLPGMAARVVSLTNAARASHGCGALRVDARLTRSARTHSLEMARTGRLSHNSPDGASPWDRMDRAGYHWGAAENIGTGYGTPEEAVRGWLDSRDHRRNILDCGLKAIGVGVASGPGGPWWTQDFGTS
ncbi:CAP domain-containing protein [Nonomuraea pusilla]|uniref:Uncharacterized conserved protein YkwD, contains CAP (CSP/antigen 5/PR1) domain n=1 Tax=Nonomuraea pusilla TaxID=46177 RepID=A0A1H7VM69_9ACTN|nr:CAP domain-containing protein [Nonomuraea pusilla]SEM10336.1 Uncharacterized conserved protein YkwD, contains CAP (CSP/antigen 5/PR1) domain [Nonomuraea pusilla]